MLNFWRHSRTAATLLSLALSITIGCSDSTSSIASDTEIGVLSLEEQAARNSRIASVAVTIDSTQIAPARTARATAVARDNVGRVLSGTRATKWRTDNSSIAIVSDQGIITGVGLGTTAVRGTIEGFTGEASIKVAVGAYRRVATVTVTVDSSVITVPHVARASATLRDSDGNVQPGVVTWQSGNASVATVASDGTITAVSAGDVTIAGTNESVSGITNISVVAPPSPAAPPPPTTPPPVPSTPTASLVAVSVQPSTSSQSGVAFAQQPVVQLRDAAGAAFAQSGVVVSVTVATGSGSLGGTLTATTSSSGAATFTNLSITGTIGARTLRFSAPNLTSATSSAIAITAGAPSKLAMKVQPSAAAVTGVALSPQPAVQIVDVSGNTVARSGVAILAAISTGTGGTLSGTTATTDAAGLATFSSLTVTGSGSYSLQFSTTIVSPVTSALIDVGAVVAVPTPAPAPSGSCSNEPSGFTDFNEQPWDATPIRGVTTPQGWVNDNNGTTGISIVNDATALFPTTTTHNVAAGIFRQGTPGGSAPFYVYRPFGANEQYHNLYICAYVKHDANFDNTNGNAGTKFLWPAGDQVGGAMTYTSHDGPSMNFAMIQQGPVDRFLGANMNAGQALVASKRGRWMVYEMLLKGNSNNSTANGELHMWLDGVKTHQYTNVNWQMGGSRTWQSLAWNPTYGGGLNPVPHDQFQYLDHVRISGSP